MNTQGRNIWVFNTIKNPGKINLKELLNDCLFIKERKTLRACTVGRSYGIFMGLHLGKYLHVDEGPWVE